ncbi:MAG: 4'-phosphopantetheinyl transferase superfamily protein [Clostridia bacterium]|nr:4'-phosphopantetheinyl transferase superfamily protein [Clostridia bacterium]
MLLLYGIKTAHLPSAEELRRYLGEDWYGAWRQRHQTQSAEVAMRQSLGGLCLLRSAAGEGRLAYTPEGKPYFVDGASEFSITHTADWIFCAVCISKDGARPLRVGVDAEDGRRLSGARLEALSARWFSPEEQRLFSSNPTVATFLRLWTRKEALVKWTGEGLRGLRKADTARAADDCGLSFWDYEIQGIQVALCANVSEPPPTPHLFANWAELRA